MRSKQLVRIIFIALALLLALATPALMKKAFPQGRSQANFIQNQPNAQPATAPQIYSVSVIRINPGMGLEYQEWRKAERLPALRKGGVKQQSFWGTAVFGQGGEYVIVTPIESLAQYDGPGPVVKALGEEGARAHNMKMQRFIKELRTLGVQLLPSLSIMPNPDETPKIASIVFTNVAPGRAAEYESYIKNDILPIIKKAGAKGYVMARVALGGDINQYISSLYVDSWADLQKVAQTIGADIAKVQPKMAGIVVHQERSVTRYYPELSIQATAQKAGNK